MPNDGCRRPRTAVDLKNSAYTAPMPEGLYLGKEVDPHTGTLGARLDLDPTDLLTHGLVVGMTGSGKTGLAIALIEEALKQGVPVIAIDPKGDLGNLLLLFERLDAASFAPWIDPEAARREGKEVQAAATEVAAAWKKGLAEWGLSGSDVAAEKMGALSLESVYPRKERHELAMALNNLLASPGFETWREGEPLDVARLLHAADGRPRLSIVYTAHLSDEERLFVTALLLDKVKTWMRQQGGTTQLRALIYMDEIFGYFPPHPANPPTKRPLLTLLKQARAQGVGVVLATQNPVDLDYKGLANMGTWMVGTLQTQQDRDRLMEGLTGTGIAASAVAALLGATRKRVFLLHDVHRAGPCLLHSRWALSYLRGPLTREEISRLMKGRAAEPQAPSARQAGLAGATAPILPAPLRHH